MAQPSNDMQAPLLSTQRPKLREKLKHDEEPPQGVGIAGGVSNLTKCIIGAGMLSLPRAFVLLGLPAASIGLLGVSFLTFWTIKHGLVTPSVSWAGSLRLGTYSSTVNHWLGKKAEKLLVFMMLLGGLGFEASCLDIIADIMLGTPHNPGLLSTIVAWFCKCQLHAPLQQPSAGSFTPVSTLYSASQPAATCALHSPGLGHFWLTPSTGTDAAFDHAAGLSTPWDGVHKEDGTPSWVWLMDRRLILVQVLLVVILPLSLKKHMGSLSAVNGVGLVSLFAFLVSMVWLAVAAIRQGVTHSLPWAPALNELGKDDAIRALHAFGVLSVLLTATACHGNIHPLMSIVQPFHRATVNSIVMITLAVCFAFYLMVSVCALLVFGKNVQEDILTNLTVPAMAPLVGAWVAQGMALVLRLGYMVSVLGSAVLNMFPLRQAVVDLLLGPPPSQANYLPSAPGLDHAADTLTTETTYLPAPLTAYTSLSCAYAPSEADSSLSEPLIGCDAPDSVSGNSSPAYASWQHQERDPFVGPAQHTVVLDMDPNGVGGKEWQEAVRKHAAWRSAMHAPLTIVLLLLAYVLAVTVPSIWVALSLVGSVSITCLSFMMPAAIGLCALRHIGQRGWLRNLGIRASLYVTAVLGALMFINGFVALYMDHAAHEGRTKD